MPYEATQQRNCSEDYRYSPPNFNPKPYKLQDFLGYGIRKPVRLQVALLKQQRQLHALSERRALLKVLYFEKLIPLVAHGVRLLRRLWA